MRRIPHPSRVPMGRSGAERVKSLATHVLTLTTIGDHCVAGAAGMAFARAISEDETMPVEASHSVEGHVSRGFEAVREAFADNLARRGEVGGAGRVPTITARRSSISGRSPQRAEGHLSSLGRTDDGIR